MLFTGMYEHTIDPKNRLAIPSQIRDELDPERDGSRFYVVPGQRAGMLAIYPEMHFRRLAESRLPEPIADADALTYDEIVFPLASAPLEPDKQGRILLPEKSLRRAGIGRHVMVVGVRDHLELWNKSDYEQFLSENLTRFPEILFRARQSMPRTAEASAPGGK